MQKIDVLLVIMAIANFGIAAWNYLDAGATAYVFVNSFVGILALVAYCMPMESTDE